LVLPWGSLWPLLPHSSMYDQENRLDLVLSQRIDCTVDFRTIKHSLGNACASTHPIFGVCVVNAVTL
jgi:hypothetical protein